MKGNKYIETLVGAKTDFTVKVADNKYYLDGFIIFPDGKRVELHKLYQRVPEAEGKNSDIVGT